MLPLFIIEDNTAQRELIERVIRDYIIMHEMDIDIVLTTANPHECLEYLSKHPHAKGIYFIDIDLKMDMDGIELGRRIKELDPNGRIVIVTAKETMARLTFVHKLEALDYIVKESAKEVISRIEKCVRIAYDRWHQMSVEERKVLELRIGKQFRSVPMEEVCFIETSEVAHRLILHTINGKVEFRGNMRDFESSYPSLTRVHRSFLVNLDNIEEIDEEQRRLRAINGNYCYLSTRKLSSVRKALEKRKRIEW